MLGIILGLIAGAAQPLQASVNVKIKEGLRSVYFTTLLNFIAGGVIVALIILATERDLYIPLGAIAENPFWIWLGGPCGTVIVMLNLLCLPHLGSARNVVLICFGQIMTGLLVDHYGLFGSLQISMSMKRLIGAVLVSVGILLVNGISAGSRKKRDTQDPAEDGRDTEGGSVIIYIILAVICGFACAAQVAINGTLSNYTGTGLKATLVSTTVGFIATALLTIAVIMIKGRYAVYDEGSSHGQIQFRPWMISGGALAFVIVGGNIVVAPLLGTGIVTILNLVGMMAGGLVIDAAGFLGIEKKPVTAAKIAGMLLMIAGAALITF